MLVRSYAVATFLVGQGHAPVEVEFHGAGALFIFRDAAQPALTQYNEAKSVLDDMVARKSAVAR